MKRSSTLKPSATTATTLVRSGVFSVGANPATDGIIGKTEFVTSWQGVTELDSITDSFPPPAILMPHWFVYTQPYHWN